jgi:hypothetical protein
MQQPARWTTVLILSAALGSTQAQIPDSLLSKPDSTLTFGDSLAVFRMIDSLMALDIEIRSELAIRLGYNSNILAAGRTLGIEQFGLAPAITYYHKSGLYADITTYWSKDFDPHAYLTTATIGYLHLFANKFSATAGFDHYFYNSGEEYSFIPYSNALTLSPSLELNPFSVRLDYSFYFGDAYANRIMPGVSGNLRKKNFLGFDRVTFYPSFYVLFGDELITELEWTRPANLAEALDNARTYGTTSGITITERKVFGLMNYAFSAPLNLATNNWLFNVTYTYSIPRPIGNEPFTLTNSGFISASVVFYIEFGRDKSPL